MEKLGVTVLFGCMVLSISAMEEQQLRDAVTQHVQNPYPGEREEKEAQPPEQESPTCAICYEDMLPTQTIIHTQCTPELHNFHMPCLAQWYGSDQSNYKKCPECRTVFSAATKKKLEKESRKIRLAAEEANPELRQERENKRFWGKFFRFTALGLVAASVIATPLVLKEYACGPGPRGPVYAQAASVIIPVTMTAAMPLRQHARRLEREAR